MKRAILILAAILVVPGGLLGAEPLHIDDLVLFALRNNPALRAAEARRGEVEGGVKEARAEAYPQLAMIAYWNQSRNPSLLNSPDFEGFLESLPEGFSFEPRTQELYGLSLDVSQPVYTFGKIGAAIDLARLVVEATEAQIETARLDTALAVAEAYYQLLAAEESLEVLEIQERARKQSLEVVEARFELGDATRLEQLQAQASLAELPPIIKEAEGLVIVARYRLRTTLGLTAEAALELAEPGSEGFSAPALDDALRIAYEHRPELLDLELQAATLDKQGVVVKADGKPQVDLTGAYGRTVRLPENFDDGLYDDWRLNLGLRWEFFDGGRRKGQLAQLESRRQQLHWQLESLRHQVRLEVETALTGYDTALAQVEATRVSAEAAREASRVARESYEEGVSLQLEWLDAQEREIQAEVLRVRALQQAHIEEARLNRAQGLYPNGKQAMNGVSAVTAE